MTSMQRERVNPMAGPAYVVALKNALEKKLAEYHSPPRTGGTQISTRLDDFVLNHVEAIVQESGWNRAEVMYALIQRGLFDLYHFILHDPSSSPSIIDTIVQKVIAKGAPPQPPVPSAGS
jgi:hypothetical protein